MLVGMVTLIAFLLAGEALVGLLALPVPGSVLGLGLLLAGLGLRGGEAPEALAATADGLLRHLSLLFVPAGTGIVAMAGTVEAEGPAILAALVGSLVVALAAGGHAMERLRARAARARRPSGETHR